MFSNGDILGGYIDTDSTGLHKTPLIELDFNVNRCLVKSGKSKRVLLGI